MCGREVVERRITTALTSGGLPVREYMDRRCVRLSLACWLREAQAERPLSVAVFPLEVLTLGGRGTWSGVRGSIIIISELVGTLDWSRTLGW